MSVRFLKMNGAGNDFVVFDARSHPLHLSPGQVRRIAARDNNVTRGCDQVIVMEPSTHPEADVFMRIWNADGGEVNACGNATRCIAWLLIDEHGGKAGSVGVETKADVIRCEAGAGGVITAHMTAPAFDWQKIPLSRPISPSDDFAGLPEPVCINIGNPHAVFLADDPKALGLIAILGPALQDHGLFPEGVNVSIAHVEKLPAPIIMRVWERGVGLTASCGTAACAVVIAGVRKGLREAGKFHTLSLTHGEVTQHLEACWQEPGHVLLRGPVELEFEGEVSV